MQRHTDYLPTTARLAYVDGYSQIISDYVKQGMEPYFINFMFHPLPGKARTQNDIMVSEVTRVHGILRGQIVRKYDKENWRHLRPVFIGCRDQSVWKHEKVASRLHRPNDGMHFNVVALVPPRNPLPPGTDQHPSLPRQSKLHVDLERHFWEHNRRYQSDWLYRIDVSAITYGTMADYALKAFKWGNVTADDILVLN
jgi:hypothetical protein